MKAVYCDRHRLHSPGTVVEGGVARPSRDVPARLDALLRAVRRAGLAVVDAVDHGSAPLAAVHTGRYLDFLAASEGTEHGPLAPAIFETRPDAYRPDWSPIAKAGYHLRDQITPLGEGTWQAAYWAAQVALTAAALIRAGERRAYALCRPSGHHAGRDFGGGATYLNNAAIAARALATSLGRVSLIDIDVHHGNGTQDIFWDDASVLYASVHEMPLYPGTGAASERGTQGTIVNVPLRAGDGSDEFRDAFETEILPRLDAFRPDLVVISAGFDAHWRDPLADLNLREADFTWATQKLMEVADRHAGGRIVSVLEGGYDLDALAKSTAAHVSALMEG